MTIGVKLTDEMISLAKEFAIKKQPTSYPRFGEAKEQQLERLTAGKIGEIVGQKVLDKLGIPHECPDKFKVVEEMEYKNEADSIIYPKTDKEKTVDFKTAWRPFHTRILVPEDMFESQYKDIYVGIKVDFKQGNAQVYGYVMRQEMETKHDIQDFGEGPAYWVYLSELHDLKDLPRI